MFCLCVCLFDTTTATMRYRRSAPPAPPPLSGLLRGAGEAALVLSAASSGIMGVAVAVIELKRGARRLQPRTGCQMYPSATPLAIPTPSGAPASSGVPCLLSPQLVSRRDRTHCPTHPHPHPRPFQRLSTTTASVANSLHEPWQ